MCVLSSVDIIQTLQSGEHRTELHKIALFCAIRFCCVQKWETTPNTYNSCLNHRKRTTQKAFLCNSFSVVVILSPFISAVAYHATALMNCCRERGKPCNNSYVCYFCPQRFSIIQRFIGGGSFCFLFFVPLARKKVNRKSVIIFSIKTPARGKEKNNINP